MVLERNPNFPGEPYPSEGEPGDEAAACSTDAGKRMPFIDKVVFSLEKESIPYWNKFLQGYYDVSGITSDNFDQVVQISGTGDAAAHRRRWRSRASACRPRWPTSIFYIGLQHARPGGGRRLRARAQAAPGDLDRHRSGRVHLDLPQRPRHRRRRGRSRPASSATARARPGINRYMYDWVDGKPQRKSIEDAKKLLAEAGYPDGIDAKRQAADDLLRHTAARRRAPRRAIDWLSKQFQKINLQLVVRSTDYNRFQDKMRKGTAQLYYWGWNADYPDPENFLFLFHGPQGKVKFSGENASNYANPEFDRLFERMRDMENWPGARRRSSTRCSRSCGATRPGSGACIPRTTAWRISGCTTASPTRWPTTRSSTSASTRNCATLDNKNWGVTLGGPIIKNKTFFFVNADWTRFRSGTLRGLRQHDADPTRSGTATSARS